MILRGAGIGERDGGPAAGPPRRDPLDALGALFASHRVDAHVEGDWLRLPRGCRARAVFFDLPNLSGLQLDVVFEPWIGTPVIESIGGFGASRVEQEADAWRHFARGSLPVLLAAFLYHDEAVVERTAWQVDGAPRAVTVGEITTRGAPPDPAAWRAALRAAVERSALPEGTHWVRLFSAQRHGKVITEVLLDNEPWDDMQAALAGFAWPASADYYSVRVFLILQGGVDVSRAIADLVSRPGAGDEELASALIARGASPTDAALLIAFIPIAFGRMTLQHLRVAFSPDVLLMSRREGTPRRHHLADQPIYNEAAWLAGRETLTREQYLAVARRSPELAMVTERVSEGQSPEHLTLPPPAIRVP